MQDQFDTEALIVRVIDIANQVRRSEAYPAILGAIAGGIAGAFMAVLIAGRSKSRHEASEAKSIRAKEHAAGWALRDALQLLVVLGGLVKQIREFYREQRNR